MALRNSWSMTIKPGPRWSGADMIVMCFDLSSKCIGVTFAQLKGNTPTYAKTLAIIPETPNAKDLGYTTALPKTIHYNGAQFPGLLKPGEYFTSRNEAKRRLSQLKSFTHKEMLKNIGKQCGFYLDSVKPDAIAMEKNKAFNGVLTTKLLAEIAGGLYFYAGLRNIPLYDYDVGTVRSNIRKSVKDFTRFTNGRNETSLDTKWEIYCRLRSYFEKKYPGLIDFSDMTMDESDSLAVFYHLLTAEPNSWKKG